MTGRPLRFLLLTTGGWTGVRVAMLWPTIDSVPALIRAIAPPVAAATAFYAQAPHVASAPPSVRATPAPQRDRPPVDVAAMRVPVAAPAVAAVPSPAEPIQPPPLRLPDVAATLPVDRFAASAWAVARGGIGDANPGSQLGGSQAGVRVTYAIDPARRIVVAARLSSTLNGRQREAAVGIDWQPGALPVHLVAERRIALDGGRGGTAAFVVAGVDPRRVAGALTLDAYGQAGGVARGRIEPFADGAARLTHPLPAPGTLRLDLGIGAWGAAQRGVARVDIGPTMAIRIPAGRRALRIALDWRQRIAGNARPGSGPALSVGSDF